MIPVLPIEEIIAVAVPIAAIIGGSIEITKKLLGTKDWANITVGLFIGQAVNVGYWAVLPDERTLLNLYYSIVSGVVATMLALGFWKITQPRERHEEQ